MEGSSNNFSSEFSGSPGHFHNQQFMNLLTSPMPASDNGMHMTPPHHMMPSSPQFQVPVPHLQASYHQPNIQQPGEMHGQFVGSPHFMRPATGEPQQRCHEPAQDRQAANAGQDEEVEEVLGIQVAQGKGKKKGNCHRGPRYEMEEDRVLCSGWLNISKDATIGTNQDKAGFYQRLRQYFIENTGNNKRSINSIQQRWSTIQTRVSKFSAILSQIERLNQSGKNYQDMVNDAIKVFQEKEPWHYGHCWEMLRDEPKWNDKVLEVLQQQGKGKKKDDGSPVDAPTASGPEDSSMPARPEGRDAAKKRKADTSSSSVAVDMLKKMHDRGQEMDEIDSKHKDELMTLERAKFDMQQKQWQAKIDIMQQQVQLQREAIDAQVKVQMEAIHVERMKNDTQIMFTDTNRLTSGLREWVLKRQLDIMIRDGVQPPNVDGSRSNASPNNDSTACPNNDSTACPNNDSTA